MTSRILAALLGLSFVGICMSYQGQADPALNRGKQGNDTVVLKYAVQIPTPKEDEVVVIFESGNFAVAKLNQMVTIPADEHFRTVVGERASFEFREKGSTSGNNFWLVTRR